jgi:hypothetical protein
MIKVNSTEKVKTVLEGKQSTEKVKTVLEGKQSTEKVKTVLIRPWTQRCRLIVNISFLFDESNY